MEFNLRTSLAEASLTCGKEAISSRIKAAGAPYVDVRSQDVSTITMSLDR